MAPNPLELLQGMVTLEEAMNQAHKDDSNPSSNQGSYAKLTVTVQNTGPDETSLTYATSRTSSVIEDDPISALFQKCQLMLIAIQPVFTYQDEIRGFSCVCTIIIDHVSHDFSTHLVYQTKKWSKAGAATLALQYLLGLETKERANSSQGGLAVDMEEDEENFVSA